MAASTFSAFITPTASLLIPAYAKQMSTSLSSWWREVNFSQIKLQFYREKHVIRTREEVTHSVENQRSQVGTRASEANLWEKNNVSCHKAVTDSLHSVYKLKPILSSHQNVQ